MFNSQPVKFNIKKIRKMINKDIDETYYQFETIFDTFIHQCKNKEQVEVLKQNIQEALDSSFSDEINFIFVKGDN